MFYILVVAWTNTWLMRLNVSKCKVMHLGKKNNQYNNLISGDHSGKPILLEKKTKEERDVTDVTIIYRQTRLF